MTAATKLKANCSLEEKLWQCIKKQRQHFANKGLIVKAIVSPVVMYRCESSIIKKELWCLRRNCSARNSQQLRVLWTARRSKQSILKKINPEYSLEGLMLKVQSFGHLTQRANSLEDPHAGKRLRARGEGADTGWDGWMPSPTQWTWVWVNSRR